MTATSVNPDLDALADKHGIGAAGLSAAIEALRRGHGRQAQFNHPDLGGMGQWSSGGMIMVGDMFNNHLKAKVAALFDDLVSLGLDKFDASGSATNGGLSHWPGELGTPSSTGSQNDMHYAVFPETRRLAVRNGDHLTVYDTGDRHISGVSQQQNSGQDLRFAGPGGPVNLSDLPVVSGFSAKKSETDEGAKPHEARSPEADDIFAKIERLHALLGKGVLTQEEFDEGKRKLLDKL